MLLMSSQRAGAQRLQELRINAGLTPNMLAREAGVSGNTVLNAEAGVIPLAPIQLRIAKVFDLLPLDIWPLDTEAA